MDVATAFVGAQIRTTQQLRERGITELHLTEAVHARRIIRVRRGYYALPLTDADLLQAVRVGGRLGCVSAARRFGVWVVDDIAPHIAIDHGASRLRSPRNRFRPLEHDSLDGCTLHWGAADPTDDFSVSLADALAQIVRCQPMPIAIAALDSALNQKLLADVDGVFAKLPRRYQRLARRVDGRSMSGIETLVRLMVEDAGIAFDIQVTFDGIGTVDLVVGGRVVIEVDGRAHHHGNQLRDYSRDARLAAQGYLVLRFDYAQVMFQPALVLAAIRGALAATRETRGRASHG